MQASSPLFNRPPLDAECGRPTRAPRWSYTGNISDDIIANAEEVVGRLIDPNLLEFASPRRLAWMNSLADKVKTPTGRHVDENVVNILGSQREVLEDRCTFRQRTMWALQVDASLDDLDKPLKTGRFTRLPPKKPATQRTEKKKRRRQLADEGVHEPPQPLKIVHRDNVGRVSISAGVVRGA